MNNLPNFLIIGAQKGGSTWLYDTLSRHNQVYLPKRVELSHFNRADCGSVEARERYKEFFLDVKPSHRVMGEKTPSYLWSYDERSNFCNPHSSHNRDIPASVKGQLGRSVKLISSLRHPVWRSISSFFHHAQRDRIDRNSTMTDQFEKFGLVDIGFYARHLELWREHFDAKQFLTLIMERDTISEPKKGLESIFRFLDIEEDYSILDNSKSSTVGQERIYEKGSISSTLNNSPVISAQDIKNLMEIYKNSMDDLREFLSDDLPEWREIDRSLERYIRSKSLSKSGMSGKAVGRKKPKEYGIDISIDSIKQSSPQARICPPARLSKGKLIHDSTLGAFSYIISGYVYSTDIGRYCSIARDVNIGQGNHVTEWLSTHPYQYERFTCNTGVGFDFHEECESLIGSAEGRSKALKAIRKGRTKIGNDVWMGHGVIVMPGITIGDGAVIGAGSVVTKDIPSYAIAVGVPAKVIKYRFESSIVSELVKSQWWDFAPWDLSGLSFDDPLKATREIKRRKACGYILPYQPDSISISKIQGVA